MAGLERVVAIGLLTERDLAMLGHGFQRAYRLPDDAMFDDLLIQIDAVDSGPMLSIDSRSRDHR